MAKNTRVDKINLGEVVIAQEILAANHKISRIPERLRPRRNELF